MFDRNKIVSVDIKAEESVMLYKCVLYSILARIDSQCRSAKSEDTGEDRRTSKHQAGETVLNALQLINIFRRHADRQQVAVVDARRYNSCNHCLGVSDGHHIP